MKAYEVPVIEIIILESEDVLTASIKNNGSGGGILLPEEEWED